MVGNNQTQGRNRPSGNKKNYSKNKPNEELFFVCLKQDFSVQSCLSWNSLCIPGCPPTQKSASQVLELKACTITSWLCIHSFAVGHLSCFQLLANTNKATMYIVEHVPLWHGGASFEYSLKSTVARSSGRSIFNFLKKVQNIFLSEVTQI